MAGNRGGKQRRFAEEYIIDRNATKAAERAGYSPRTAYQAGFRLLKDPQVQQWIAELTAEQSKRTGITADRTLKEVARLAFSDIGDVVYWDRHHVELIPRDQMSEDARRAIAEISVEQRYDRQGNLVTKYKVKMHSKPDMLEKLMHHLGLLKPNDDAAETAEQKAAKIRAFLEQIEQNAHGAGAEATDAVAA